MKNFKIINAPSLTFALAMIFFSGVYAQHEQEQEQVEQPVPPVSLSQKSYINSTKQAYQAMQKLPADQPLHMLNMIKFAEIATYEPGSQHAAKNWTGRQAYREYGKYSTPILLAAGGKVIYSGEPQLTLIGPEHERWDAIFIISYPNAAAFLKFVNDPAYKKHAFHRSAAVADSRLIRLRPEPEQLSNGS